MAKHWSFLDGRRIRLFWLLLILLAAFVLFLELIIDVGGGTQTPPAPPVIEPSPGSGAIPFPHPSLLTQAQVVSAIDGDTIDAQIEGQVVTVRYYGSDAPERGAPCFEAATDRNRQLVQGQTVFLQPSAREQDDGGRLLRYVFTNNGLLVDEILIREGLAKAWQPDGTYRDQLVRMETEAASNKVGCLWR